MKTNGAFSAGWGEADITPHGRQVELSGQYYQRMATGVHSPLRAVALVLSQGKQHSLFITLDVVAVSEAYVARLQQAVHRTVLEISPDHIVINAIHTHNAPGLEPDTDWYAAMPGMIGVMEFQALVEKQVLAAVRDAWAGRQPAGVAHVLDFARIGHCRRAAYADGSAEMYGRTDREDFMGMEGGEDSGVDLVFFFDAQQRPTGAIVNVACPSQVMEATDEVSSDYMGATREKLKKEFGAGFVTLCQIAAAGCQSPRDLARNYKGEPDFWHADGVEVLAERLTDAVRRGYAKAAGHVSMTPGPLRHETLALRLPKRRASYAEYLDARRERTRLEAVQDSAAAYRDFCAEVRRNEQIPGRPGPYDDKRHHFVLIQNQEAIVKRYETQMKEPEQAVEVQVIRLGDLAFATNPFELYLEFGQRIKARSAAAQTLVVQLANGCHGYLPSARGEALGGYGGMIINGTVGADGGRLLVDETVAAIGKLFGS
ncbi:MAG: hypothetical protein WC708_16845 [Lentisphaeria bacterium]